MVSLDISRRVWIGSLEVTELIRRHLGEETSSAAVQGVPEMAPSSMEAALAGLSSPTKIQERAAGFWFNLNAELIIYGATEPDAQVEISGRPVRLRSDGTFSYRFSLPDGEYGLVAVATSASGNDSRSADLNFRRSTHYTGHVTAHPQDAQLNPPQPEHIA
jgi:hypothetical protein